MKQKNWVSCKGIKQIESVDENFPPKKTIAQVVTGEFYQAFKEKIIPILHKLFHNAEKEITLPIHFMKIA